MQFLHFFVLILTLSMLWNFPFMNRALSVQHWTPAQQAFRTSAQQFEYLPSKGIMDIHAIRRRLRLVKLRACGPAC